MASRLSKAQDALLEASKIIEGLLIRFSKGHTHNDLSEAVWRAYSQVEYAVLLLKLELKVESPISSFKKLAVPEDLSMKDTMVAASDHIASAIDYIQKGEFLKGLEAARKGRDLLKLQLIGLRRQKG